jgi:hypothetical protein
MMKDGGANSPSQGNMQKTDIRSTTPLVPRKS